MMPCFPMPCFCRHALRYKEVDEQLAAVASLSMMVPTVLMQVRVHVCVRVCARVHVCVCMGVFACVCMCVCVNTRA